MKQRPTKTAAYTGATRLIDVANEAGVARVTAAQVLNGTGGSGVRVGQATRERILAIAARLRYRPNRIAQQLKGVHSKVLGVIMDTVNLPVMSERLAAIEASAQRAGYRLMIGQTHGDPTGVQDYLDDFEGRAVEGVLCLFDPRTDRPNPLPLTFHGRCPLVFHARPAQPDGFCVRVDTEDATAQVTGHLLDRGRRRVGLALWNLVDEMMEWRRRGYARAHQERGRSVEGSLIWVPPRIIGPPEPLVLDEIVDHLVVKERADAIVAPDDIWAVRLMQRLKTRGYRVPTDVAVTGYDNLELSSIVEPSLTTVDQQHDAYADAAVALLVSLARGEDVSDRTRTIKAKLVIREST